MQQPQGNEPFMTVSGPLLCRQTPSLLWGTGLFVASSLWLQFSYLNWVLPQGFLSQ